MYNSVRPAVPKEWYHLLPDSITLYTFLAYHSMFCTFISTLMVIVNAVSNPCHGFFSLQYFHTHDVISVVLPVTGFICSWNLLSVLENSKTKSEPKQKNGRLICILYLVTTVIGTFLAFCLFLFVISESHFIDLWGLILPKHFLQNIQYFSRNQTLSCFRKFQLIQLGVVSFSCMVAGGASIIRFFCPKSLRHLITPGKVAPLQLNPEEYFQRYSPPEVIPAGSPNQRSENQIIVSAVVHSAFAPDVIPTSQFQTANDSIQQISENIDNLQGVFVDTQSVSEPSEVIDSASRPPHLADIGSTEHLHWIDELKQYLANSNNTNCGIPESTEAINLPVVGAHLNPCGNECVEIQKRIASVSSLGSTPFSKTEIKEELRKILEDHISKQSSSSGSRLTERRGAVSGPSGNSVFDESEISNGESIETFAQSLESTESEKQIFKKPASSSRKKYSRSPNKSGNGVLFFDERGSAQSEFSGVSGLPLTENDSKKNECQKIQLQNQQSVFSQIGGDIRALGTGRLSSDSDECGYPEASTRTWSNHFGAPQASKTGVLSSDSDEPECKQYQIHSVESGGSEESNSNEFRSYSSTRDRGRTEGHYGNADQFGGTANESATGVRFDGAEGNGNPKQVFTEFNTNPAPVITKVTPKRVLFGNQRSQQPDTSKSTESEKSSFKSNRSGGTLVIQIDHENVDDQEQSKDYKDERIVIGASMPLTDNVNRPEDHPIRRLSQEVNSKPTNSSLVPFPPAVSLDEDGKFLQKPNQLRRSNTYTLSPSSAAITHPGTSTTFQNITSDAHRVKQPNGETGGHQNLPESISYSNPHSTSPPKLVSQEKKSDESSSGRRDSRTFAMDLDNVDESLPAEGGNKSGRPANRSRLSSDSTDSGSFLDNLFYTDNDDSLI